MAFTFAVEASLAVTSTSTLETVYRVESRMAASPAATLEKKKAAKLSRAAAWRKFKTNCTLQLSQLFTGTRSAGADWTGPSPTVISLARVRQATKTASATEGKLAI